MVLIFSKEKQIMKAAFEKIPSTFGSSFSVRKYDDPNRNKAPFWHYHPELEMVYIRGGGGKRHIGNHMSYFNNGDLIFIGSNVPHSGFTDGLTGHDVEVVVQMNDDFLGKDFFSKPEMLAIHQLFERSRLGLSFNGKTREEVGARLEVLNEKNPFERLIEFLSILYTLAISDEYEILNVSDFGFEVQAQDNDRIRSIYKHIRENFQEPIALDTVAGIASMTVPAFCRYFKKLSGKPFTKFVNEYRVVHACKLLSEEESSISEICFESGFKNVSNFNKFFKQITGKSPSEYRKDIKKIVE